MARYFDAFRIDHILGFFRIWEIPANEKSGSKGHFNPALSYSEEELGDLPRELFTKDPHKPGFWQPLISADTSALDQARRERFNSLHTDFFFHRNDAYWKWNAQKKLPELLGATGMLACGEDLGMVPDCVQGVMDEQRILSLEMPMMEKGRPWPRRSVCATSSHDMDTLRMQQPADPEPWEVNRLLFESLKSDSMLAIFPIQDWLAINGKIRRPDRKSERINEPADPHHHWRFRLHIPLEFLAGGETSEMDVRIASMLKDSGRFQ